MKVAETAAIMIASLSILGLAGLTCHRMYYAHALDKMADAFYTEILHCTEEQRRRQGVGRANSPGSH